MVKLIRTTIIACLMLYLLSPSFLHAKRVALVIGNGAYQEALLKNPVNDANDMAKSLETLEFEVIKVTDANLRNMYKALNDFTQRLSKKDVALFFYAGHGVQVQGENYLLPTDHNIQSVSDVRYEAFPVGRLVGRMEEIQSTNIIILDACRNNPLSRSFKRSLDRGLAVIQRKPEGTFIAYATAPGKTAADGDGKNGLFTSALLKHMFTAGLDISSILRKVRTDVKKMSLGEQVPWSESSLTDTFYFKEKLTEIQKLSSQNTLQKSQPHAYSRDKNIESLFWESIKDSENPSTYEAYIQQFPNGIFVPLALLRITKYSRPKAGSIEQESIDAEELKQFQTDLIYQVQKETKVVGNFDVEKDLIPAIRSDTKKRVAILPGKVIGGDYNYIFYETILKTLNYIPEISVAYVFKRFDNLTRKIKNPGLIKNNGELWTLKNFFSNYKPNLEKLYKIGKILDVDIILLFISDLDLDKDYFRIYSINISNNDTLSEAGTTESFSEGDGEAEIERMTTNLFSRFRKSPNLNNGAN